MFFRFLRSTNVATFVFSGIRRSPVLALTACMSGSLLQRSSPPFSSHLDGTSAGPGAASSGEGDLRESRFNRGIESALVLGRLRVGFDLLHVPVDDAGCR